MNPSSERDLRRLARRRVSLRIHAVVYACVIPLNWLVWALTWTGHPWPLYPTLGWGLALALHYLRVYSPFGLFSMTREVEKLRR